MKTLDPLRAALTADLTARQSRNRKYSLRAYARDLGLGVSTLSEFLSGARELSPNLARRIITRAGLPKPTTDELQALVSRPRQVTRVGLQDARFQLDEERFSVVSDWQHFALLSLLRTRDFCHDTKWMAKRLRISERKVRESLRRLISVGCIKKNRRGGLEPTQKHFATSDGVPSATIVESHRQAIENAKASLLRDATPLRDFLFATVAIDPRRLPEAREMTRSFLERLVRHLGSGDLSEVYGVSLNVFPLSAVPQPSKSEEKFANFSP